MRAFKSQLFICDQCGFLGRGRAINGKYLKIIMQISMYIYRKPNKNKQGKANNTKPCNCELECSLFYYITELGYKTDGNCSLLTMRNITSRLSISKERSLPDVILTYRISRRILLYHILVL